MTATVEGVTPEPTTRLQELRRATADLRTRATSDTEHWLLLGGAVLVPLGLVFVVAGYWGASHAPRVIQQVPYLISGGLLGMAVVFAGAFSYFAFWLTRIVREQQSLAGRIDAQTATLAAELAGLRADLRQQRGESAEGLVLVSTPTGSLVHLPTCRLVAGRADLRAGDPDGQPCKVCQPNVVNDI